MNANRIVSCLVLLECLAALGCGTQPGFTDAPVVDTVQLSDVVPTRAGDPCGLGPNGEAIGGCSSGQLCLGPSMGFPGGYCAPMCGRTACAAGSSCLSFTATMRYCALDCMTDADCRSAEGYVCRTPYPGGPSVCLPNAAPVGRQPDGGVCYSSDGDASTGPFMAPLPTADFTGASTSVSYGRLVGLVAEQESSITLDPTNRGGALVGWGGFVTENMNMYYRGGVTRLAADGSYVSSLLLRDRDYPDVTEAHLAFDSTGRLHVILPAADLSRPGGAIRYTSSDDGGMTFPNMLTNPVSVFTETACALRCESPTVVLGPAMGGMGQTLYVATLALQANGSASVLLSSTGTSAPSFTTAVDLVDRAIEDDAIRDPASIAMAPGAGAGQLLLSWVAVNSANALAPNGDPLNRVRLATSMDGGGTFGTPHDLTRMGDQPIAQPPVVGVGAGVTHLVYVTGGLSGHWDIVLATSTDPMLSFWTYRVVNDDPSCATHAFVGMAVSPVSGDARIVWLDNRFGPGEVAYASCPADPTEACSRNQLVSGIPFPYTTAVDPTQGLGNHSDIVLAPDGAAWAAWTDTRMGGSGAFAARGQ